KVTRINPSSFSTTTRKAILSHLKFSTPRNGLRTPVKSIFNLLTDQKSDGPHFGLTCVYPLKSFNPFNLILKPVQIVQNVQSLCSVHHGTGPFQTFQSFNRYAPVNAFGGSRVQSSRAESEANFHVSGILETSKRSKTGELGANVEATA